MFMMNRADSSKIPTILISKFAKQKITVALLAMEEMNYLEVIIDIFLQKILEINVKFPFCIQKVLLIV